jgi:O-acetyl-ADP-ribose deacetylase
MRIAVVRGDITTMQVDAIVNAANSAMRGGGGVDGAIHRAAGPSLLQECIQRFPKGLPTGAAGWTHGHQLPARFVIHVVGPNRHAGQTDPDLLASCYRDALRVADEITARTLAFPLVSAGVYGWDTGDAARIAVQTLKQTASEVTEATMVAFGADAERALRHAAPAS